MGIIFCLSYLVSAGRRSQGSWVNIFAGVISYRRTADTRELWALNSFSSSRIGGPPIPGNNGSQIHSFLLISAARRYQGSIIINFNCIISYRRPTDNNGNQKNRVSHLHYIGGLRVAVDGSDLLCPASSSSIGRSSSPIGKLSANPFSYRPADTVLSANTAARST